MGDSNLFESEEAQQTDPVSVEEVDLFTNEISPYISRPSPVESSSAVETYKNIKKSMPEGGFLDFVLEPLVAGAGDIAGGVVSGLSGLAQAAGGGDMDAVAKAAEETRKYF